MITNFNNTGRNDSKFCLMFFLFSNIEMLFTGKEKPLNN